MRKSIFIIALLLASLTEVSAQNFEAAKLNADEFTKTSVKVGADFALQYQAIDHEAKAPTELIDIKKNINLPTANLNLTADLAPGVQLFINTYLSSRHHNEAWVEGGYLVMDRLPFLPAADDIMKYFTIKAGVMMPNYGDAHFYRSNNAAVSNNPFVGNWIMDAFTTNPGLEITFREKGFLGVIGANNGRMNYGSGNDLVDDVVFNWKLGYDTQINEDIRVRGTFSGYHVGDGHSGSTLWDGDRAGARYYYVMQVHDAVTPNNDTKDANFKSGRWGAGSNQTEMNSYMANLYVELYGLELFGMYETMKGKKGTVDQEFTQTAGQAIYRIGDFYLGTRLNKVDNNDGSTVNRTNVGGGWNMLESVVVKLDYVTQKYKGVAHGAIDGGKFNGIVLEAAISF